MCLPAFTSISLVPPPLSAPDYQMMCLDKVATCMHVSLLLWVQLTVVRRAGCRSNTIVVDLCWLVRVVVVHHHW